MIKQIEQVEYCAPALSAIADRVIQIRTIEDCREVIGLLSAYRRAYPDDHYATDVAKVISKVIDAKGWNEYFPD